MNPPPPKTQPQFLTRARTPIALPLTALLLPLLLIPLLLLLLPGSIIPQALAADHPKDPTSERREKIIAELRPFIQIDRSKELLTREDLESFLTSQLFASADTNNDNQLSLTEFTKAFDLDPQVLPFLKEDRFPIPKADALRLFTQKASDKARTRWAMEFDVIDRDDLDDLVRSNHTRFGLASQPPDSRSLYPSLPTSLNALAQATATRETRETEEALAKKRGKTLLGQPWDETRGMALHYTPKSKDDPRPDTDQPRISLQVLRDFAKAGSTRKPALVQWSRNEDEKAVMSIDAAARLEYTRPDWRLTPAAGAEWTRTGTGSKKVDRRSYHLELSTYPRIANTSLGYLRFGPEIEQDQIKGIDRLQGILEWELNLGELPPIRWLGKWTSEFPAGTWNAFRPAGDPARFGWYYRPRISIAPNKVLRHPGPTPADDWILFGYSLEVGARFFERITLTYQLAQGRQLEDWHDSFLRQEASVRFQLDDEDRFSLELGFTRGRESLDDDPVDRWVAGLGFKF